VVREKKSGPILKDRPLRRDVSSLWLLLAEQIGYGLSVCIAGMVETGQSEAAFQRAKQRKMVVEDVAGEVVEAVVGVDNRHYLVDDWLD
jgi:hypothetical protein